MTAGNTPTADFRNRAGTGTVAADQLVDTDGNLVSGITVSTTAIKAELDALHSQGAVAADFAKLHALTVTAAQVNTAAGVVQTPTPYAVGCTGIVNITTANANTGTFAAAPVLAGVTGLKFVPVEVKFRCNGGTTAGMTALTVVEETSGRVICSVAIADLITGHWATCFSAAAGNVGLYIGVAGTAAKGLYLKTTGTLTSTTSIDVMVFGYWTT
jgi:hypothetical protein